jgi:hypothetical protein
MMIQSTKKRREKEEEKEEEVEWRTPKFLVKPKKGPTILKSGSSWNLVPLLTSNTKGGWKGCAESFGIKLGRGTTYLVTWSCIKTNQQVG